MQMNQSEKVVAAAREMSREHQCCIVGGMVVKDIISSPVRNQQGNLEIVATCGVGEDGVQGLNRKRSNVATFLQAILALVRLGPSPVAHEPHQNQAQPGTPLWLFTHVVGLLG